MVCGPGENSNNSLNQANEAQLGEANATNIMPVAVAGENQVVDENGMVSLAGMGADSDGTVANYEWTQVNGPPVLLSSGDEGFASFLAPTVTEESQLTFQLAVTDNAGTTALDSVNISVSPPTNNDGPSGSVCPDTHPTPIIFVSYHYALA